MPFHPFTKDLKDHKIQIVGSKYVYKMYNILYNSHNGFKDINKINLDQDFKLFGLKGKLIQNPN